MTSDRERSVLLNVAEGLKMERDLCRRANRRPRTKAEQSWRFAILRLTQTDARIVERALRRYLADDEALKP